MSRKILLPGNLDACYGLVLHVVEQGQAGHVTVVVDRIARQGDRNKVGSDRGQVLIEDEGLLTLVGNGQVAVHVDEIVQFVQGIAQADRVDSNGGGVRKVSIRNRSGNDHGLVEVGLKVPIDQAIDRVGQGGVGLGGTPELVMCRDHGLFLHDEKLHGQGLGSQPVGIAVLPCKQADRSRFPDRHNGPVQVDGIGSFDDLEGNGQARGRSNVEVYGLIPIDEDAQVLLENDALTPLQHH